MRIHVSPNREFPKPAHTAADTYCFVCDRHFTEVEPILGRVFEEDEAGKPLGAVCADCLSNRERIPDLLRDTADLHEGFVREGQVPPDTEDLIAYRVSVRRRLA